MKKTYKKRYKRNDNSFVNSWNTIRINAAKVKNIGNS